MGTRFRLRLYILAIALCLGFVLMVSKLWEMQIRDLRVYQNKVPGMRELKERIPGVRGEIKDRKGRVLVTNKPNYEVIFDLRDIISNYRKRYEKVPKIKISHTTKNGKKREWVEDDIVKIVNETVIEGLKELGLHEPYSENALRIHYRSNKVVPWTYRKGLNFQEFARFAEHDLGLPGVSPTVRPVRHYLYGALACHLLGYVKLFEDAKVSVKERKKWDFYVGDDVGARGIEKTRNEDLRGTPGVRTLLKNEKGALVGEVDYTEPKAGSDVYLTLDLELQYIAENALRDAGVGRGSAVVLDPANGNILAMASVPSFNPNLFIPNITQKDWDNIRNNPTKPLNNKAVQAFPPGSIYKIPIALGGCLDASHKYYFTCNGGVNYGRKFKKCWIHNYGGKHGSINLSDAIMRSCNSYFYQYGNRVGVDRLVTAGKLLGLGKKIAIDIDGESSGILPSRDWLKSIRSSAKWTSADTANMAIGQGDVLATPLQMCAVTAAVANGGTYYPPSIVDYVVDPVSLTKIDRARRPSVVLSDSGILESEMKKIRKGMLDVVNKKVGGTGKAARLESQLVAGKTGTAQAWRVDKKTRKHIKDLKTWFISFAPYDTPRYAVCILVEGGKSGGSTAAPIAKRILERSFQVERKEYKQTLVALEPEAGHFNLLEKIEYPEDEVVVIAEMSQEAELNNIEPINETTGATLPKAIPIPDIPVDATPSFRPSQRSSRKTNVKAIPLPNG